MKTSVLDGIMIKKKEDVQDFGMEDVMAMGTILKTKILVKEIV